MGRLGLNVRREMSTPLTVDEAEKRLRRGQPPKSVLSVLQVLQGSGHQAVLVGGGVRDMLLGLDVEDWDIATDARPQQVQSLFRRTVATGIQHGTVTVLLGGQPVEVTTYRGEGAYLDGRRPSEVRFLGSLTEDLARRDFTVNAIAWDPIAGVVTDPFGGLGDLGRRVIRAVGDPLRRFSEDGLRTLRAVRFCATRGFSVEQATLTAITPALPVLDTVSRERVVAELCKLLASETPSLGLRPLAKSGMWPHLFPGVADEQINRAIDAVDQLRRDASVRLARVLLEVPVAAASSYLDTLPISRKLRATVLELLGPAAALLARATSAADIRRAALDVPRELIQDSLEIRDQDAEAAMAACAGAPLTVKELTVRGRDLIAEGVADAGPTVGGLLRDLLLWTCEDPGRNSKDLLLARAREIALGVGRKTNG